VSLGLFSESESLHFVSVARYIFDLRHGQNAARVGAAYLGFRLASAAPEVTSELIELAAALEIANTSITYIEDKLIDGDLENLRGEKWTHARHGPELAIVVNSFVHFLSHQAFHGALQKLGCTDPSTDCWLRGEFENIFRDANYGQFLDVTYGGRIAPTSLDCNFCCEEDPCGETLSDHINDLRTGQFVRRSAELGAVFGGIRPDADQMCRLRVAMRLVGICVQDLNDLQDFLPVDGFPGSCGKDLGLLKKTLPVIRLIESASRLPQAAGLIRDIEHGQLSHATVLRSRDLMAREGIFSEVVERILLRLDRAHGILSTVFTSAELLLAMYFDEIRLKTTIVARQLEPAHI
jgi:geranylgeranyl pyrophosphate synthase